MELLVRTTVAAGGHRCAQSLDLRRMRLLSGSRIMLCLAVVTALSAVAVLARLSWQIYVPGGWRDEVQGCVGAYAARQAMEDFRDGHLRHYRLGGELQTAQFTGETNGVFEIWSPQFYPELGPAHRYSTEQFINFYNRKMNYMHSNPGRFLREGHKVQPDGAANGSQPIRSEANRTSSMAGSRR
jgi:hypothetical protein